MVMLHIEYITFQLFILIIETPKLMKKLKNIKEYKNVVIDGNVENL